MSVFSLIKRGRAQAKEHNTKKAEKVKEKPADVPYRHVVTHAAIDALSGAPSSWKYEDRPRIMEQNKRRSAMTSSGTNLGGMPRVGSTLSYVSYPSPYATPVVPLPKNYSYSSVPASWREKTVNYSEGIDYFSHPGSLKGKERESPTHAVAAPRLSSGQASELSSKGVHISESVGNSSGSDDELEIGSRAMNHRTQKVDHRPPASQPRPSSSENIHRLHPASQRKMTEPPSQTSNRHYPPQAKSTYFAAPRPLSRRAFSVDMSIPPIPPIPALALQYDSAASSSSTSGLISSASSAASLGVATSSTPSSAASTPTTSTTDVYPSLKQVGHKTPAATVASVPTVEQRTASVETVIARPERQVLSTPAQSPQRRRRLSKTRRSMDVETPPCNIDSTIKQSIETVRPAGPGVPATLSPTRGLDQLDQLTQQPALNTTADQTTDSIRKSSRKLTKNSQPEPSKTRRWSFRSSSKTRVTAA
ncbi:hypothetical protein F5B20DRAFT_419046 [Whalleya microplaca]|nr:hypothetical protein F5B20DRAFT_419046 [Whalleya microplaca]